MNITRDNKRWKNLYAISAYYQIMVSLLITLGFLAACSKQLEPPLRVGAIDWLGYGLLYLAKDLGLYDNSSIKLVELNNATDVIQAIRFGDLEAAALTLDETLTLVESGTDLSIVLLMDISNGGDVLLAKPEIETLSDLYGKKVAVEYTAVGAILLDAL